ncbi:uncharacterized protein BDV17DRAFT_264598 [Aspergillus undulatus]|uniref:uncharacterized protein n=1 Tax=Aspergillus undulatus TaxID=1810928 RepID=UPI003CCCF147
MPKLAVNPSSSPSISLRVIRSRRHLHPRPRSIPSSRCASSQVRPLAEIHHDFPPSRSPKTPMPILPTRPGSNIKYSLTDDLNPQDQGDHKPPDERIIKLGKTLRTLSPLLPTILTNPLPPHILSPSVTLHLFPSTHPHLPTVKGRTLYRAALWAVPVAWSSVPLVGNVKLQILSERIVRAGTVLDSHEHGAQLAQGASGSGSGSGYGALEGGDERLVVRWRTERTHASSNSFNSSSSVPDFKSSSPSPSPPSRNSKQDSGSSTSTSSTGTNKGLSVLLGGDAPIFKLSSEQQFTGLFIFSFDEEGRVLTQTIEHAEDASGWERTATFVTLTDWLIGKARGSLEGKTPQPGLVGCSASGSGFSNRHQCHEAEHGRWRRDGEGSTL